jgi:Na+/H+ antiporter NhaD/arsenite permease-like protein
MMRPIVLASATLLALVAPAPAHAAGLDGAALRWPWALPFIGILLTIATGPLLFPKFWHHHYGKLAFVWSVLTLAPLAVWYGAPAAIAALVHAMLGEYLSFIVLLFALYVVAGGILVTGNLRGTPLVNTVILTFGTLIASLVGTTGAAMILIRPLLRANAARLHNVHVVVFFIFLVANIGGALSPLGDPPLFVGFLHDVDFFWPMQHLWRETVFVAGLVLASFVVLDVWHYRKDRRVTMVGESGQPMNLGISGGVNLVLIAGIIAAILASALWKPAVSFDVYGTQVGLHDVARDAALVLIAILSLVLTPNEHRESNGFT